MAHERDHAFSHAVPTARATAGSSQRHWASRHAALWIGTMVVAVVAFFVVRSLSRALSQPPAAVAREIVPATSGVDAKPAAPSVAADPPSVVPKPAASVEPRPASSVEPKPASAAAPAPVELKHRLPRTGRLELSIHGATRYLVVVDGKPRGTRTEIVLPSGPHDIEVRAEGELPQRFSIQIEAGKARQRDVTWTHAAVEPKAAAADGTELLPPGATVPRRPR